MTERIGRLALAGCSGLIGTYLETLLAGAGYETHRLVRGGSVARGEMVWDPAAGMLDGAQLSGIDGVFCLGGVNIAERPWTAAFKKRVWSSRVESTALMSRTLAAMKQPPKVLVCASAIGYYGDCGDAWVDETSPRGRGFLAELVQAWEDAAAPARAAGIRVVHARIGVVLDRDGGALGKMLGPFKWGLGGRLGSGKQYMSWITLEDVAAALVHCLTCTSLEGPVNLTAPHPVTNAEFTRTLAAALHRPAVLPVPATAISLLLGEMGRSLLLSGARVRSEKLVASGFRFCQDALEPALQHVFQ